MLIYNAELRNSFLNSLSKQFFSVFPKVAGSWENVVLKYRKEPNIAFVSYIIECAHPNKNISHLWSL